MGKHIFSILILIGSVAFGQSLEKAGSSEQNLLKNPGFENGLAKWTYTGSTLVKTTTNPIAGVSSSVWTPTANNDVMRSELVTVPAGEGSRSCQAQFRYSWTGVLGEIKASVVDESDSAIVAEFDLPVATTTTNANFPLFDCSGGDQFQIKLRATASSSAVKNDTWFVGYGKNTLSISQSEVYGQSLMFPTTTAAQTTSGSFVNMVYNSTIVGSYSGKVSAGSGNDLSIVLQNAPSGRYELLVNLNVNLISMTGSGSNVCQARVYDGSSEGDINQMYAQTVRAVGDPEQTGDDENTLIAVYSLSSNQTKTFHIQGRRLGAAAGVCQVSSVQWVVKYYPLNPNNAITLETSGWYASANVSGANANLGTAAVTSYTEITNGGLTMTNNNPSVPVEIPCSGTNPSTGATCAAGNESHGIVFNAPSAGMYKACAAFSHGVDNGAGGTVNATFQVVETPNNAQTILQEGKSRINSSNGTAASSINFPLRVCGTFEFATAGKKTLRLMYEQSTGGTIVNNLLTADGNVNLGQRDVNWTVEKYNEGFPTPIFTDLQNSLRNRVLTNDTQQTVIYSANVSDSGVCAVDRSVGNWIGSVTDNGLGDCTINFAAGAFDGVFPPLCTGMAGGGASQVVINSSSASSFRFNLQNSAGTAVAGAAHITCMGKK